MWIQSDFQKLSTGTPCHPLWIGQTVFQSTWGTPTIFLWVVFPISNSFLKVSLANFCWCESNRFQKVFLKHPLPFFEFHNIYFSFRRALLQFVSLNSGPNPNSFRRVHPANLCWCESNGIFNSFPNAPLAMPFWIPCSKFSMYSPPFVFDLFSQFPAASRRYPLPNSASISNSFIRVPYTLPTFINVNPIKGSTVFLKHALPFSANSHHMSSSFLRVPPYHAPIWFQMIFCCFSIGFQFP